jgi:hypothetical protein
MIDGSIEEHCAEPENGQLQTTGRKPATANTHHPTPGIKQHPEK